jgi:hypothetical protein
MQTQLLKRNLPEPLYQSINFKASKGDLAAEVSGSFLKIPLTPATPLPIQEAIPARSASALSVFTTLAKVRPVLPTYSPIYGPFSLPDGNDLTFRQLVTGQWQATVQNDWLQRSAEMPVVCKSNVAAMLSVLQGARAIDVRSRIHIMEPVQDAECVYIGVLGVRGGGKKKKKNTKNSNGKKANQQQNQTNTAPRETILASASLDTTSIFPQLLSMVAKAKNPENEVFKALEEYRKYCTNNGFYSNTTDVLSNYNATVSDINNRSLDQVWDLCKKGGVKENIDAILFTLLASRSSYLEKRTKNIEEWLSLKPDKYPPIPTCDYLFRILYQGRDPSKVDRLKTSQECIRRRFQLINSVIIHLFHAKLAKEGEDVVFEKETKQMIEKAKHLHPLLAGGDFVGDPDDFETNLSGVSSLLQAISPYTDNDSISIFKSILSIQKAKDWMEEYDAKHSKKNNGCYDYDSKFPFLTMLQWYKEGVTKALRDEQLEKIKEHMTPHQMIRTIVSLYKEKVLQGKFNQYFEADPLVETSSVPWFSTFLEAFRQYQKPQEFVEGESFFEYQESVTDDKQGSTTADQEATPSDADEREVAHLALKKTSDERTSYRRPIHAHGRTEALVATQGSSLPLTNTSKKTWEKLFDTNYKISCKVTYACYQSLWGVLGG